LVLDSRAAMPKGGRLTIATREVVLDASSGRVAKNLPPGSYVALSICDTGAQAPPQSETDETRDQTLRTAVEIVQENKGYLQTHWEAGKGRTFTIYLPRLTGPVEADDTLVGLTSGSETLLVPPNDRRASAKDRVPFLQGSETILLVEDEESVRIVIRDVLQAAGYTVLEARHGEEGLQVAQKHGAPIQLLVTDVAMPQMNGPELAARLIASCPNLKVLYVTGYAEKPAVSHPFLDQEAELLQKPFTTDALVAKVRQMLDQEASQPVNAPLPVP